MARVLAVLSLVLARYRYGLLACLIYTVAFFQAGIHVLYVYIDLSVFLRAYHCGLPYCVQCLTLVCFLGSDCNRIACCIFCFRRVRALCPALENIAYSHRLAVSYFKYSTSICICIGLCFRYGCHIRSISIIIQCVGIRCALFLIHCIDHQILVSKFADICRHRCSRSKLNFRLNLIILSDTADSPALEYIFFSIYCHIWCTGCIRHGNCRHCSI